eukprot:scaffold76896_cov53-Cyclotella_meneghiniana.AAC.3
MENENDSSTQLELSSLRTSLKKSSGHPDPALDCWMQISACVAHYGEGLEKCFGRNQKMASKEKELKLQKFVRDSSTQLELSSLRTSLKGMPVVIQSPVAKSPHFVPVHVGAARQALGIRYD